MQWVKQETDTTCGQSCVAMVAGLTWAEAVKAVGTKGKTWTPQLRRALSALGITCGPTRRVPKGKTVPEGVRAIVLVHWRGTNFKHWVIHHEGMIWCPTQGPVTPEGYYHNPRWRVHPEPTSYMVIGEGAQDAATP